VIKEHDGRTSEMNNTHVAELVGGLRESHERLVRRLEATPGLDVTRPAFPSEWSIADALSHLGSGAEITSLILGRAGAGEPEPAQGDYIEIWDRWNAMMPVEQAVDAVAADALLVKELEDINPDKVISLQAYGGRMRLEEFVAMRLDEHVVHTWDIEAPLDASATLDPARIPHLLTRLRVAASRSAAEAPEPFQVRVEVHDPSARFLVQVGQNPVLISDVDQEPTDLRLPAETFVRLIFGRLRNSEGYEQWDPTTTDAVGRLRGVFRGY
jgi:uncharacterized protein (TIGR03083 family)